MRNGKNLYNADMCTSAHSRMFAVIMMIKPTTFLISSIFIWILTSCIEKEVLNESTIQIPKLTLPLNIRAERFFRKSDNNLGHMKDQLIKDSLLYVGQIETNRFIIFLKKKQGKIGPILYTTNKKNNKVIDTLLLFEKQVFVGTDCFYLPWITINKDFEITRTDTSYYYQPIISLPDGKDVSVRDTFIHIDRFKINKYGYIIKK